MLVLGQRHRSRVGTNSVELCFAGRRHLAALLSADSEALAQLGKALFPPASQPQKLLVHSSLASLSKA